MDSPGYLESARDRVVAGQVRDAGACAAERAAGIFRDAGLAEAHFERVVDQHRAGERRAEPDDLLDRLGGLQHADRAGQHAQYPGFLTVWDQARRRGLCVEASIARKAIVWF